MPIYMKYAYELILAELLISWIITFGIDCVLWNNIKMYREMHFKRRTSIRAIIYVAIFIILVCIVGLPDVS